MAEPDSPLSSGCLFLFLWHLLPTCREVWFLLELISGLVPSCYWDYNHVEEAGGDEG